MDRHIETLGPKDVPAIVDVLCDAFENYPVMGYVLGPQGAAGGRLSQLISLFVSRRVALGGPMFGVTAHDGQLVGAAVMTLPSEPQPSPEVLTLRDRVWAALGLDCQQRHDAYGAVTKTLVNLPPHHHLNMIGVRTKYQGQGLARPLLEAALALAAADKNSAGLSLTTELPKNVPFYEHFGFNVTGYARVTPELETWAFFKANSSTADENQNAGD